MPDFKHGQTVQLGDGRKATVRFVGQTSFQVGEWVGVELQDKTGKNDGSVQGVRYFDCAMGYGMFVKPMMATIVAQPPASKPSAVRKPARPSSVNLSGAGTKVAPSGDVTLAKRRSLNAPSPSPVPRLSRPASVVRSPTKSPLKSPTRLQSGASSTAASRTGTPSSTKMPAAGAARSRTSITGPQRTSMGPPPKPTTTTRTARQSSVSSATPRTSASATQSRAASTRTTPVAAARALARPGERRQSADSQTGRDNSSADDGGTSSPMKSEDGIFSPQPTSPVRGRADALEKLAADEARSPPAPESTPTPAAKRTTAPPSQRTATAAATTRELEDLKAKLRVLERKREEDRDKLKQLEKVQGERDKFEGIIQKLQQKYHPQQQENTELRKQLKEAESKFESIETMQAEHDSALELAALDREMAEETAEVLKMEVETLKQKSEELELEVEVLREENSEYSKGMTPEERASTGWLQMERTNERLREALLRLRDITQSQEEELRDQIAGLEEDLGDFSAVKAENETTKEKLSQSEAAVDDLRQQLDTALGAEDMIEDLTERNMSMSEQIEELKAAIDDLENLKEINDELEANHVQNEKELQDDLDFKDSVITEQARRAAQQEDAFEDMEYTVSRFRELVTSLQSDLEDMRASQAVTEGESEKLNDRSRAMMDLNMKLHMSAAKAQVKTIDLELRRLEAQEAEQHLDIVKLFLPDSYHEDRDSVLALLRFRRVGFKANILGGFIRERINGQPHPGHEDDVIAGCDAVDKLVWVSAMCDRFVFDMSHCTIEQFAKYQNALQELEPVERALNGWIDGLRRDDLKEKKCADELHRTVALMSHLAEVHISQNSSSFANEVYMKSLTVQSHLESAALSFNTTRSMVQRAFPEGGEDDEIRQELDKKFDTVMTQTRSTKVIVGKVVRALEDLTSRSLALPQETKEAFEQCESGSQELTALARAIGDGVHALLTQDEGRTDPFTYKELQEAIHQAVLNCSSASESDTFSAYLAKLRVVAGQVGDLAALATDLDQTEEFENSTAPWRLRSQELKSLKTVPADAEEELRRLKEEHNEARRTIAQRDEHLSTAVLKIETLESRMRDAQGNLERITSLEQQVDSAGAQARSLKEDIEKQDRELKTLETDRDKWKKVASDSRAYADGADAAGTKAGQERAVATAREMDALKNDISSLQAAVRFLREDNRRARTTEQHSYDWLAEPLKKPSSIAEQRTALVVAEGKDVLGELVKMASSATVFGFDQMPKDKLAWKPAKTTPQYLAARQMEDFAAWGAWRDSVVKKSANLRASRQSDKLKVRNPAAQLQIRLPGAGGKAMGNRVQVLGSREWEAMQSSQVAV